MKRFLIPLLLITTPAWADAWSDLANYALGQASLFEKNAQVVRFCQPNVNVCINTIIVNDPKGMWAIKEVENNNGQIVERDICKFNKTIDIRICTNFDTRASTKEMKDVNSNWYAVQ